MGHGSGLLRYAAAAAASARETRIRLSVVASVSCVLSRGRDLGPALPILRPAYMFVVTYAASDTRGLEIAGGLGFQGHADDGAQSDGRRSAGTLRWIRAPVEV